MLDVGRKLSLFAARFMSGTFLSRILGMVRDVLMAAFFGSSASVAAFFVAYRLANLFRRVFAEGGLLNGFVPFFEEIRGHSEKEGSYFFRDLVASLFVALFALIFLFFCGIKGATFFGFTSPIFDFTLIMLPSLLFVCLYGAFSAYLQCQGIFFLPSVAPTLFNLFWIGGIFYFRGLEEGVAMKGVSWSIFVGFIAQFILVAIPAFYILKKTVSIKELCLGRPFSRKIREMISPFFMAIIGVSAMQLSTALDGVIARFASLEGPAYLTFAARLIQLPIGLFAVSLAAPLLPLLSKAFQTKDDKAFQFYMESALERSLFFMIPSFFGVLSVGAVIVNLIYGRGAFDFISKVETTYAFWGYALSVIPTALVLLMAPAFYSKKNYRDPTICVCITVLCNIAMSFLFIFWGKLGPYSVALSSSLSSVINAALLVIFLKKKIAFSFSPSFWKKILCMTLASFIAFCAVRAIGKLSHMAFLFPFETPSVSHFPTETLHQVTYFLSSFFPFVLIYFSLTFLFKVKFLIGEKLRKKDL